MKRFRVNLGANSYDVCVGSGVLAQTGPELKALGLEDKVIVVTDPMVKKLHGNKLTQSLTDSGFAPVFLLVPEGEEQKSLDAAARLYQELSAARAERSTPVLALGGGVIGDLSGFVAATYLRGVPLVQIPTTLLAQVDSSIGGKVAVNCGQLKNQIGAFYQPRLVISDISTLKTLSPGEISDGLAETIKSAVIGDSDLFLFLERNLARVKTLDDEVLEEVIFRTAKIKAGIIEKDERDLGLRNILNFGHTVGHAVESVSRFEIGHGEAVAIGMVAAGRIALRLGLFDGRELSRLRNLLYDAGLPVAVPDFPVDKIIQAMQHDKKILRGKVRFVLPKAIGDVFISDEVNLSLVEQLLVEKNESD